MAQDWYYKLLGEETGPVGFQTLRDLVFSGHITDSDEVRTSASSWKPASEVPELFQAGDVSEPELATDYDLDMLLTPSSAPTKLSDKRKALLAAKAAANAPPPRWYYKVLGQELGPVTTEEILEQIQTGGMHAGDVVRDGLRGVWTDVQKVTEFSDVIDAMRPQPEWFCRVLGQELGPMTFEELEAMAKSGALHADDEVRHLNEPWAAADRTRGLRFSKAVAAPATSHDRSATYIPFGEDAKRKEWYYEILGQEMGPISFQDMLQAVTAGTLAYEDKARKGKAGAWNLIMDVPGLVSTDAKAAHLASKQESSRPVPTSQSSNATATAATPVTRDDAHKDPGTLAPTRSVVPSLPPTRSVVPTASSSAATAGTNYPALGGTSSSLSGMGGMSPSSYGSMASTSPSPKPSASPPPPPAFKAPKKSSGPAIDFGAIFGSLKDIANPKALAAVGAILVAGLLIASTQFGLSFGVAGKSEYQEVKEIWGAVKAAHESGDMKAVESKYGAKVEELAKSIEKQGPGAEKRLLQLMFFATKNHLPIILKGGADADARFKMMEGEMKESAQHAGDTQP